MNQKISSLFLVMSIVPCAFCGNERFCGTEAADKLLLDFRTTEAQVKVLGASVSTDNGLKVTFSQAGTGIIITAPDGRWDLSQYVAVAIDVHNVSARPVTLIGELNGQPWHNSFLHVDAGQTDTMVIHMLRKTLVNGRKEQFTGMRGVPGGHMAHWEAFDSSAVKTVTLRDLDGVSTGQTIAVEAIRAQGRYGVLPGEKEVPYFPFVDRFGQFKHEAWPHKVKSVADLKALADQEAADLARHPRPVSWNKYGGWAKGPKLKATGHFRVAKDKGKWWFVDPEGYLFWSHGIDCVRFSAVTALGGRRDYFEMLPEGFHNQKGIDFAQANQHAKYGEDWAETVIDLAHRRLRSWGMNTVGNWSDPQGYLKGKTAYVVAIHYSWSKEAVQAQIKNPEKLRPALRKRLEQERGKTSEDPWCIGYFVDNEIRWQRGMNAEVYYKVVREEVKRMAPHKLYLGSRLHGHDAPHGSRPHLVAAAAKYCDVISINRYRFSPSDLCMLEGVDKPLIIGEFHFGALDRGMLHPGLRGMSNQQQRAYAYEHYLTQALKHPHVIGTHWFQYREQNVTGRSDGENYQIGFVDICDTPYREIVNAARRVGHRLYELRLEE